MDLSHLQVPTFKRTPLLSCHRPINMSINFPKVEEEVLALWQELDAFQTQLRLTEGQQRFTFYDGPPFGKLYNISAL